MSSLLSKFAVLVSSHDSKVHKNVSKPWFKQLQQALFILADDLHEKDKSLTNVLIDIHMYPAKFRTTCLKFNDQISEKSDQITKDLLNLLKEYSELEEDYQMIIQEARRHKSGTDNNIDSAGSPSSVPIASSALNDLPGSSPIASDATAFPYKSANLIKTPMKDISELHGYASPVTSQGGSPKIRATPRKRYTPRKRGHTLELTPNGPNSEPPSESGSSMVGEEINSEDVHVKGDAIMEELINHPVLHEKLAQTINRVFNGENIPMEDFTDFNEPSSEYFDSARHDILPEVNSPSTMVGETIEANEIQLPDTAIQDIMDCLDRDPVFSDILNICANKTNLLAIGNETKSSPITTPKNSHINSTLSSPLATPIRNFVVKDLMSELNTPKKKPVPPSPLSVAIASSAINETSYSVTDSSPVAPVLDFNLFINKTSASRQANASFSSTASGTTFQTLVPTRNTETGETTYVLTQTPASSPITVSSAFTPVQSDSLKRRVLKSKRLNLAKFEHYNSIGLKRRAEMGLPPVSTGLRKLAPKMTTTIEKVVEDDEPKAYSEPAYCPKRVRRLTPIPRTSARCNLRKKFEANANINQDLQQQQAESKDQQKSQEQQQEQQQDQQTVLFIKFPDPPAAPPKQLQNTQLLKNMNVDQFLSKLHDK